ncbi:MAG: HNH endonuclease [Steroidobacteraceae bacterium]|nr:HNH endonuclease [Steroidobacteraceae bacterium]
MKPPVSPARFWSKVRRGAPHLCWPWQGYRNRDGYGQYSTRSLGNVLAHRIAWQLVHGQSDSEAVIRHDCDNRLCCNPRHLRRGTHADNVQDRVARGRSATAIRGNWAGGRKKAPKPAAKPATQPRLLRTGVSAGSEKKPPPFGFFFSAATRRKIAEQKQEVG